MTIRAFLIFTFAFVMCGITDASAQKKNISGQEKGVLAYYKVTGQKPPIEYWINSKINHHAMPAATAKQYFDEEKLRLQWGLGTFNPAKDYLQIKTKILTSVIEKDGAKYLASHFPGKSALNPPYFPYNIDKTWVALILKNIQDFMVIELDEKNYKRVTSYLTQDKEKHELDIKIIYRAVSGDREPIEIDGLKQHTMLGEIAHVSLEFPAFHQSKDHLLWEYYAPWYMDDDKLDLLKILDAP